MNQHCDKSGKATVIFSFNGIEQRYISKNPPVTVEIFNGGTKIIYGSTWIKVYSQHPGYDIISGQKVEISQECTNQDKDSYLILSNGYKPFFKGNNACQISFEYFNCKIKILDSNGKVFEKSGACPITFKVICDDDCPDGYIKCPCNTYPGYCCLPCKDIVQNIKNLANKIRV